MNCPKCNAELKKQSLKFADFYYCMNCGEHSQAEYLNTCCRTPYVQIKQHEIVNGVQLRKQCISCGCIDGQSLKKSEVKDHQRLEYTNKEKHEFYQNNRYKEAMERGIAYRSYFTENREADRIKKYDAYLQSPEWKAKRALVLKRDNHTCQCCLSQEATQVHHTTYVHLYNEPLFELQSVCEPCHDSITAMDKGLPYQPIEVPFKKAS